MSLTEDALAQHGKKLKEQDAAVPPAQRQEKHYSVEPDHYDGPVNRE